MIPAAPWLPPITSRVFFSGSRWNAFLAAARSIGCPRFFLTGVPVTTQRAPGRSFSVSSNPRKTFVANFAASRLALPGIAFDSWMNAGSLRILAASTGAVDVNPPIPRTTDGRNLR